MSLDAEAVYNRIDQMRNDIFGAINDLTKETRKVTQEHSDRLTAIEVKQLSCLRKHEMEESAKTSAKWRVIAGVVLVVIIAMGGAYVAAIKASGNINATK